MSVSTLILAGLFAIGSAAGLHANDEGDLFNMTNRLHGYVDDSRLEMLRFHLLLESESES